MEKSEAELLQLRETFRDKDDLKRHLLVDKMTDSDSSVKSYFGLPSVVTLFGIFGMNNAKHTIQVIKLIFDYINIYIPKMMCMRNSASNYNKIILWTNWGFKLKNDLYS